MRVLLTCLRSVSKEVIDAFRTTHQRARGLATRLSFTKVILSAFIKRVMTARGWSIFFVGGR